MYDSRPFVCRLYGLTERMRCPHGCVPQGGFWPEDEAVLALARVEQISGNPGRAAQLRAVVARSGTRSV